jgi:hypothetical protein
MATVGLPDHSLRVHMASSSNHQPDGDDLHWLSTKTAAAWPSRRPRDLLGSAVFTSPAQDVDRLSQRSEVAAQHQPQNGCRRRIQTGLDLEKRAVAILKSHQDVKSGFIIEVAE